MNTPENDPSIEHEPHLKASGFTPDPSERMPRQPVDDIRQVDHENDAVERTVWDEPGLSPELAGKTPSHALTYADWLDRRTSETTTAQSWGIVAVTTITAGPWAVAASLVGTTSVFAIIMLTVLGPVMEEMMKVAAVLWIIEKRPFWFKSRLQIMICVLGTAFVFSAVENNLYLNTLQKPSEMLVLWRWTVCVALHMGCTCIAGFGLMKIWNTTIENRTQPQLASGATYMITAIVIHGVYNGFALIQSLTEYHL